MFTFSSRKFCLVFALSVSFWFPSSFAIADELSYNYLDVSYLHSDGANGGVISGSVEVSDNVRLSGGGSYASNSGVDTTGYAVGIGYVFRYSDSANFVIDAGYSGATVDTFFGDVDLNDPFVGGSLRFTVAPSFEIEPSVAYLFGDTDELTYAVDARYWFIKNAAVQFGVGGITGGGDAVFNIGFRFGAKDRPSR